MVAWFWLIVAFVLGGSMGVFALALIVGGTRGDSPVDQDDYSNVVGWRPTAR